MRVLKVLLKEEGEEELKEDATITARCHYIRTDVEQEESEPVVIVKFMSSDSFPDFVNEVSELTE